VDPASSPAVESAVRSTTLVCAAIVVSVPIYVAVAWVLASTGSSASVGGELPGILFWVLAVVAVAQLLIAQVVWGVMVRSASRKPAAVERLAAYRTATVVAFALRESTALIGLVLTLLGGDQRWCLGLSALAVVAMLLSWPRRADMVRLAADPATLPIG